MLKIRRPLGRLIFNMGIAIPGKTVFLIETAPWLLHMHDIPLNAPLKTQFMQTVHNNLVTYLMQSCKMPSWRNDNIIVTYTCLLCIYHQLSFSSHGFIVSVYTWDGPLTIAARCVCKHGILLCRYNSSGAPLTDRAWISNIISYELESNYLLISQLQRIGVGAWVSNYIP